MSAAPTPSAPKTDAARAQAALWRQVELLETLAEAGVQMAQAIAGRVTDHAADESLSAAALAKEGMAFSRAARAVRMTALLQSRLIQELEEARGREALDPEFAALRAAAAEEEAQEQARQDPAFVHKARVEAIVERVAKAQYNGDRADDEDRIDRLVIEAGDRLDDEDIYGDVLTRPVGELVSLICRDLGLNPDWEKLGQEAWAVAEIASGAEGSPFLLSPSMGERPGVGVTSTPVASLEGHPPPGREQSALLESRHHLTG